MVQSSYLCFNFIIPSFLQWNNTLIACVGRHVDSLLFLKVVVSADVCWEQVVSCCAAGFRVQPRAASCTSTLMYYNTTKLVLYSRTSRYPDVIGGTRKQAHWLEDLLLRLDSAHFEFGDSQLANTKQQDLLRQASQRRQRLRCCHLRLHQHHKKKLDPKVPVIHNTLYCQYHRPHIHQPP